MTQITSNIVQSLTSFFTKDARHFQLVFLSSFALYGMLVLDWINEWPKYLGILGGGLVIHSLLVLMNRQRWNGLKSTMITCLGLCLLLHTTHWWVGALAILLAVASKQLLRWDGRHFFNPANFGLLIVILLSQEGWVSPGQWGNQWVMVCFFTVCALMVLMKVGRLDTSFGFLATFAGLTFIRKCHYLNWSFDVFIHQMSSGSLLLFTFFMITDPKTTPFHPTVRWIWAAAIGVISFILTEFFYVKAAPIWVLLFAAPTVPLLNRLVPHNPFEWSSTQIAKT